MAYDKAKWHHDGDFPADLEPDCGGTHIGMFVAWAFLRDLADEELIEDAAAALDSLRSREITGRNFLFNELDGVLGEDDLNDEGNAFAAYYYQSYMGEYDSLMKARYKTAYHAEDNWPNFEVVSSMIEQRYQKWLAAGRPVV